MGKSTILITVSVTAALLVGSARGQTGQERPVITAAHVYLARGIIMGDVSSRGLFSEEIAGTVQSGLPAVVELLYKLNKGGKETVHRGMVALELRYDVWEDRYLISDIDTTRSFATFQHMVAAVETLRRVAIVPLDGTDGGTEYAVEFSLAVHPLRGKEKRKIAGWVGETVRGDSPDTWRNQIVNLNDLIQRFFDRDRGVAHRSEWFVTPRFRPRLLPKKTEEE